MSAKRDAKKSTKSTRTGGQAHQGLSAEELAAMKETLRERKAAASREEAEQAVLEKIAQMPEPDHSMAMRLHALIKASAPTLLPRTWYGMPAYANAEGKVICFFQSAQKFNARYATFGFNDGAHLDDGSMWPTAFAPIKLTAADEARIGALVKKAVS